MRRIFLTYLLVTISIGFSPVSAFAKGREADSREPDSEYMEKEREKKKGSGLFDFLPFVGGRSKEVSPEKLVPSPLPLQSKPVLSKGKLEELGVVADQWLQMSEFTEPTVRRDEGGGYFRDYIVFAGEYRVEVLRGDAEDKPFVGYVYVKGDYFRTRSHGEPADAESDFNFTYRPNEFRLIFDRVERWDYSYDPDEEPFTFTERWEFRRLQSRPIIDISEGVGISDTGAAGEDGVEAREPVSD
ncbi:MAG: hypothetical protein JSV16_16645 [Candidatus Hydrogenedentota bacterium]|nr:MAG: hypothetical protein JSV16_16645 [Candidatus Hydrogenedentota bacterium]